MKKALILLVTTLLINALNSTAQQPSALNTDSITTVYYPLIANSATRIFDWAINRTQRSVDGTIFAFYKLYLNTQNCKYSFFVPSDKYFETSIDPIAFGQEAPQGGLQFKFNTATNKVYAVVRMFNKNTTPFSFSDSVKVITDEDFIQDRLWKILDNHIVVGDVESGKTFFVTKSNDILRIQGSGTQLTLSGGYEWNENKPIKTTAVYRQSNGTTYFIDKPIQPALKSVYKVLRETPAFSGFFSLLKGIPDSCAHKIFYKQGVDTAITMFHTYRYTVYVPTNAAIQSATDQGLIKTWAAIAALPDGSVRSAEINKLIRFLKYHFQDEAVFFGQNTNGIFNSATIKNDLAATHFKSGKNRFYKIGVNSNESTITLTTETNQTAHVVTSEGLYNLIAKDYTFSKVPSYYKNLDGSGPSTGASFMSSYITTSSSAVIHQIDQVLTFQ